MKGDELVEVLAYLSKADGDDEMTRKVLRAIRTLAHPLANGNQQQVEEIVTAVAETLEYSPEYNRKHGLPARTTRMHDPTYG